MENNRRVYICHFFADAFAMVTFSTAIGFASEMGVAGMDFSHSAHARLVAVPVNLLIARPYGIFRDWFLRFTGATNAGYLRKAASDLTAFVLFQVPLYATILVMSGATWTQITSACISATVLCAVTGRPYGIYLDWCRKLWAHIFNITK